MSKCPFISRDEAVRYAFREGDYKVSIHIDDLPNPDPDELIAAAIKQMNLEDIFRKYLKISECLFRSITNRKEDENTINIGCERPGVKLEVSITVEESDINV